MCIAQGGWAVEWHGASTVCFGGRTFQSNSHSHSPDKAVDLSTWWFYSYLEPVWFLNRFRWTLLGIRNRFVTQIGVQELSIRFYRKNRKNWFLIRFMQSLTTEYATTSGHIPAFLMTSGYWLLPARSTITSQLFPQSNSLKKFSFPANWYFLFNSQFSIVHTSMRYINADTRTERQSSEIQSKHSVRFFCNSL